MRQILNYFSVIGPDDIGRQVVVSQEITTDQENVVIAARKLFTLDTPDGEGVSLCADQRSFMTNNNEILRVVGRGMTHSERQGDRIFVAIRRPYRKQ